MARPYAYATSRQALLQPAVGVRFFEEWTPADTANRDLLCAELSRLAYAGPDIVTDALAIIGFTLREWVGSEAGRNRLRTRGTDGFVATSADGALTAVAFRGTEANKLEDVIADLLVTPTTWPAGGRVHGGFAAAYAAERDQIRTALARHHQGDLLITGHSLGAALATLAAADHRARNPTLITFGSPRVGDEGFSLPGVATRRFVNCCDVVARIPPERFTATLIGALLGELSGAKAASRVVACALAAPLRALTNDATFRHSGPLRYADRDGAVREDPAADAVAADQGAARSAYPGARRNDADGLIARLRSAGAAGGDIVASVRDALQALARGLLAGDPLPRRDLADHAPINYVSLFTGRH